MTVIRFKKIDGGIRRFEVVPCLIRSGVVLCRDKSDELCSMHNTRNGFCGYIGAYPHCSKFKVVFMEIEK